MPAILKCPDAGPRVARRRWLRAAAVALGLGVPRLRAQEGAPPPEPRTLTVGPGARFSRLADALREAADGDTILLAEGEYRGDVGVLARQGVTLRGLGAGAVLHADGRHAEGKATLVVRGEALIENLEFRGARVPSGNGAGIRFERGRLALLRCRFFDNENGLLSANEADMTLDIADCEFGLAPRHPGLLHHLLYVGHIGRFTLTGCRFSGGWRGHLVKSRALVNVVRGNWLADGDLGEASYELEFPNGGRNVVVGNVIAQSPATQNPVLLSMGAEGRPGDTGSLLLAHNTFVDGGARDARFVHVWAERLGGDVPVAMLNNFFAGSGRLDAPAGVAGNHHVPLSALRADHRLRADAPRPPALAPLPAAALPLLQPAEPLGARAVAQAR